MPFGIPHALSSCGHSLLCSSASLFVRRIAFTAVTLFLRFRVSQTFWACPKRHDMHSILPTFGSFFATASITARLAIFASPVRNCIHRIDLHVRPWLSTTSHTSWICAKHTSISTRREFGFWSLQRSFGSAIAYSTSWHLAIQTSCLALARSFQKTRIEISLWFFFLTFDTLEVFYALFHLALHTYCLVFFSSRATLLQLACQKFSCLSGDAALPACNFALVFSSSEEANVSFEIVLFCTNQTDGILCKGAFVTPVFQFFGIEVRIRFVRIKANCA